MSKLNSATINMTEIKTVDAAREFSANVKTAFDEDKKSLETPSAPVQSVPAAAAQVPVPSATPSNVVSNIVPSATPLSEQKKIMDATRMPVMPVMPYIQKNGNNDNKVSIAAGAG
jgi:hypothetical protein